MSEGTIASAFAMLWRPAAWLITGPVGHLVAGVVDWCAVLGRYAMARARGHDPWEVAAPRERRRGARRP